MDISELPVSKSGGPRVDVDALMAELEDARLDASTTAGQLADALAQLASARNDLDTVGVAWQLALAQVEALAAERDAAMKKADGYRSYGNNAAYQFSVAYLRAATYRARALALIRRLRTSMQVVNWATPNVQAIIDALETARTERATAESRLAAQQGALETLRGLLARCRPFLHATNFYHKGEWMSGDELIEQIDAALAGTSPVGQAAAAEAQPAGEGPAGRAKGGE